jgi:hypothetical protein
VVTTGCPAADGVGYGVDSAGIAACLQPPDYSAMGGDCDDRYANCTTDCTDTDGDTYCVTHDCDETNPDTHPEAPEVNDGLDIECPGDAGHGLADEISGSSGFDNTANLDEIRPWRACRLSH